MLELETCSKIEVNNLQKIIFREALYDLNKQQANVEIKMIQKNKHRLPYKNVIENIDENLISLNLMVDLHYKIK